MQFVPRGKLHPKSETSLSLNQSGGLGLSKKQKLENMNITGEHRVRQTFLRRALAYDLANVKRFAVLGGWKWSAWNNPECRQGRVGKGRRTVASCAPGPRSTSAMNLKSLRPSKSFAKFDAATTIAFANRFFTWTSVW